MNSRLAALFGFLLLASSITHANPSEAPHPLTVDDLFGVKEAHDSQMTPDGQFIAYTVNSTSLKEDKSETRIWMIPTAGGVAIPLTAEGVSSSHPRWSPDGAFLAFLSSRKDPDGNDGKTQVYVLNRLGGEAQRVTDTVQDVDDFEWAPDGKRLVLILRDPSPDELESVKKAKDGDDAADKKTKAQPPWVLDRLQFKMDTIGYIDRRRTHLYVFNIATKTQRQVTSGDFDDSAPAWSPDGKLLAFESNRTMPDPDRTYNSDIWVVAADNSDRGAHPTQVTNFSGEKHNPSWSPDGKWLTYETSTDIKLFYYATKFVGVSPAEGGEAKILTKSFDRMATLPRFAPDGKSIYFLADDDGTMNLAEVNIAADKVSRAIGGRLSVESYTFSRNGALAATISTADRPYELFTLPGGQLTRLTHLNDDWLARHPLVKPEYVSFQSKDGTLVHGYLYKPVGYVAGKKYPTILRPHGGPVEEYEDEFFDIPQLFAANGYAVLLPNPRGSSGYGQAFCKAIFADWGIKDFQDDMAFVDYALAEGFADPDKLGVGGWSYGGISTDFIIGQTNRFKAAISGAGAANFISMWGHDQYQREYVLELGYPWENQALWDRIARFFNVQNILTPTLFVGGNIDCNVPILGGEQMYLSLKELGRDTLLVVYPDEYHEFKTPSHIKDLNERYLAWYAHYVKADGTPARPDPTKDKKAGD
ncbi:MAG TPA: S9 family peptidase [Candidatus Eisenbacteria bacterium]|nr:S9 family peptidase [Candidatus Eisenbacteria bacterium]